MQMQQETQAPGQDSQDAPTTEACRTQVQNMFLDWLREAVDARLQSGIEDEWQEAEDLYAGIEPGTNGETSEKKPIQGRSRVIINITEGKTGIGSSQVIRRVLPGDMRPWNIDPTPVPEYDDAINGGNGQQMVTLPADGSQHKASDVAKALTVLLKDKAKRAGDQIQDWLTDTAIYNGKTAYAELRKMIKDGARVGTGVIKGPIPTNKSDRRWTIANGVATIVVSEKLVPRVAAISVRNCFPDPSCGDDIHRGTYFIERDYLTPREVRNLQQQPGYEASELATVLKQGPVAYSRWDDRYKNEQKGQTRVFDRKTFETFYLYADLTLQQLLACGYQIPALTMAPAGLKDDEAAQAIAKQIEAAMSLASIPVVATMINGRIVKVVLNPNEKGGFPYRFFRWSVVEGRPYGKGIPIKIATPQKMLTSAARATMENAGQSAGPQLVYADGVVKPVNNKYTSERNKHWTFTPGEGIDDVRKAFALFNIPSVQEQLFNIIKASQEWADQLGDIPLLMQGITGNSPDTLGGMEMLEANAASPLLDIAKEYDEVLTPLISDFYDWLMQDPNVSNDCKGDFQCRAIGASVLIHRDRKALALQQVVAPMANDPAFGLSKELVGKEILKGVEIDPDSVSLTEDQKQQAAQQPPPMDPRIEAAQIKAKSDAEREASRRQSEEQDRQFKAAEAERDRVYQKLIKDIELQIQEMQTADEKNISVEQMRAMLAKTALELRNKRDLFVAERQFAMTDGHGRGL